MPVPVVISSESLPVRMNFEIIRRLQEAIAPAVFTPRGVYDGRKNMFTPQQLDLGGTDTGTVCACYADSNVAPSWYWSSLT